VIRMRRRRFKVGRMHNSITPQRRIRRRRMFKVSRVPVLNTPPARRGKSPSPISAAPSCTEI